MDIGRKSWVPRNARGHSCEICPPLSFRRLLNVRPARDSPLHSSPFSTGFTLHSLPPNLSLEILPKIWWQWGWIGGVGRLVAV